MKITSITPFVLRYPLGAGSFYSSQCPFPERNSLLVKVETDNGVVGWGEGGQYGPPEPVEACIRSVLGPLLLDRDPRGVAVLWEEMYTHTRDFGQKGPIIEAISAIDIALWDIKGRALGVPVCELLGGAFRETVKAYATGCYYRAEDMTEPAPALERIETEALGYVAMGFDLLKIKIGLLDIQADARRVEVVRQAIGDSVQLLTDANHAYNAHSAIRMGRLLEDQGVILLEEPVPPEDRVGYREVRRALNLAVGGGECEYTRFGFRDLIGEGCVDIVQPDLCVCGGFSEFQKILGMALSHNLLVVPHVWGSGIAQAAALQAIATIPSTPHTAHPVALQNEPVMEFDRTPNPLRDDLLSEPLRFLDGRVQIPMGPGLGVEVNEEALASFTLPSAISMSH